MSLPDTPTVTALHAHLLLLNEEAERLRLAVQRLQHENLNLKRVIREAVTGVTEAGAIVDRDDWRTYARVVSVP